MQVRDFWVIRNDHLPPGTHPTSHISSLYMHTLPTHKKATWYRHKPHRHTLKPGKPLLTTLGKVERLQETREHQAATTDHHVLGLRRAWDACCLSFKILVLDICHGIVWLWLEKKFTNGYVCWFSAVFYGCSWKSFEPKTCGCSVDTDTGLVDGKPKTMKGCVVSDLTPYHKSLIQLSNPWNQQRKLYKWPSTFNELYINRHHHHNSTKSHLLTTTATNPNILRYSAKNPKKNSELDIHFIKHQKPTTGSKTNQPICLSCPTQTKPPAQHAACQTNQPNPNSKPTRTHSPNPHPHSPKGLLHRRAAVARSWSPRPRRRLPEPPRRWGRRPTCRWPAEERRRRKWLFEKGMTTGVLLMGCF